jgi:hypothetical protein
MSSTLYDYEIATAFPNQKANGASLKNEIIDSSIVTELEGINVNPFDHQGYCDIWFVDALTSPEEDALNAIIAAHQGNPPPELSFRASSCVKNGKATVTSDTEWEDIGGVVTTLSFFIPDVEHAWGRLSGQVKVTGSGAKLRVIRQSDGLVCTPADVVLSDTGGGWSIVSFWANQNQPAGPDRFILQGKLDGATSLEINGTHVAQGVGDGTSDR